MEIDKLELVNEKGEIIKIGRDKLSLFFAISKFNAKKPFDSLKIKGVNKSYLFNNLFLAVVRKIIGKKPAVTEKSLLSLFTKKNFKKINLVVVHLSNKKKITLDIRKIHLLNLLGDLRGVLKNNQYNIKDKDIKDKIIIDAGAHNGEFSMLSILMGAKKVYAFEPVFDTSKILKENIRLNGMEDKIIIIQKALGDKNENANINFDFTGDGAAKIGSTIKSKNSEKIEIIKLDDFVEKNKIAKIGFIKMDVEGFESNVLKGAEKTIKTFKPILSFSAYHNPEDKTKLPKIVTNLREDYKIVLNNFDEEDFYCY